MTSNSLVSVVGFSVRAAVTFVVTPILVTSLGDRRYGVWSLVESVLAYLSLFDVGILAALVRNAARFEARHDWDDLNRVVNTSFAIYLGLGAAALSTTMVLALSWSRPLGAPADLAGEIRVLLLLLGASLAVRLPLGSFASLLDSLGQYPVKTLIRTIWSLIGSLILVLAVKTGHGLVAVGIILTCSGVGETVTLGLASYYFVPQLRLSQKFVDRSAFRTIFSFSMFSFLAMIAGRISFQTDALVISAFLAPEHITFFMIAARLVEFAKEPFRVMAVPFMPAISAFQATSDHHSIHRLFARGTRLLLWLAIPFQAGFAVLGKPFLALWMGQEYAQLSYPVLLALSATLAVAINQMMAVKVIYGMGNLRFFTAVAVLEAVANLAMSILLVKPMGILGVALGTAVPNVVSGIIVIVFVCRMLGYPVRDYVAAVWLKPLAAGLVLLLAWLVIAQLVPVTSWPRFILVGSLGTALYSVIALWAEFGPDRIGGWIRDALVRSV